MTCEIGYFRPSLGPAVADSMPNLLYLIRIHHPDDLSSRMHQQQHEQPAAGAEKNAPPAPVGLPPTHVRPPTIVTGHSVTFDDAAPTPAEATTEKRNQSKYDFVKVRVWVEDHFYVLSRYLVCRALCFDQDQLARRRHHLARAQKSRHRITTSSDGLMAAVDTRRPGPRRHQARAVRKLLVQDDACVRLRRVARRVLPHDEHVRRRSTCTINLTGNLGSTERARRCSSSWPARRAWASRRSRPRYLRHGSRSFCYRCE